MVRVDAVVPAQFEIVFSAVYSLSLLHVFETSRFGDCGQVLQLFNPRVLVSKQSHSNYKGLTAKMIPLRALSRI